MPATPVDALLARYVECADDALSEVLLEQLVVEHAQPTIRKVVRHKLTFQERNEAQDVEDVSGEVVVELIARLRSIKINGATEAIESFTGYTAVAAYHACNEYLRRKYPNRHRLKNRLRYLLHHEKKFAIWESEGPDWICGLRKWQSAATAPAPAERVSRWREVLGHLPHGKDTRPVDLLARVFEGLGGPVAFDDLVDVMAWFWGVEDPVTVPETTAREIESGESDPGQRLELRKWLTELWAQIRELPRPQRVALLLNLRAGPSAAAISLLPVTGISNLSEIADTLGFTVENLAALWPSLPMEDLAIAEYLGLSRQQVINLRKSARERLIRRIGGKYSFAGRY